MAIKAEVVVVEVVVEVDGEVIIEEVEVGEEIMEEGEAGEITIVVEDMEEAMVMMNLTVTTVIVTGAEVYTTLW